MEPAISIIVPVYNYGEFLEETLTDLQNQAFSNWECIIVNDGSTDDSAMVSEKFLRTDQRFKYYYQENKGLSAARNAGIKVAQGKYIQLLDADDLLSEMKLMLQYKFMEDHSEIDLSYTHAIYFNDADPLTYYNYFGISAFGAPVFSNQEWIPDFDHSEINILAYLMVYNIAPVNSYLVRKDLFDKLGGFDSLYKSLEDWELWFRAACLKKKFAKFTHPDAFAKVRVHSTSMSFNNHKMNIYHVKLQNAMIMKLKELASAEAVAAIKQNRKHIEKHFRSLIRKTGILNFNQLAELAKEMDMFQFTKLYVRELLRALVIRKA